MTITTDIKLTSDQAKALIQMKEFCTYVPSTFFRLTGYAGTGKTFVVCQLIKWLIQSQYNIIAVSPTNKAANNLRNIARENGIEIEVITLAKLLGKQAVVNEETGKEEFISQGIDGIGSYDVIIVDEFSMISSDDFIDLKVAIEDSSKTKVVFVGDSKQLPPVGEKEPIVSNYHGIKLFANLTTVVRYDGELANVAEQVRNGAFFLSDFKTTNDHSIICASREEWLESAAKFFKSNKYKKNPDYCRFLVWRNKTAQTLNAYVRQELWGKDIPTYAQGDRLIAKTPVFRTTTIIDDRKKPKNVWNIVMNASEECEVISDAKVTYDNNYGYQHYVVPVITSDGMRLDLRILTDKGLEEQKEMLMVFKERQAWKAYYNLLKSFDNVPYAYAITTHKAQGSSIDKAFVDIYDMRKCPDLQKILYTGLTRAKEQVFVPNQLG